MRQRLGVARSLLNDPELLILDEPTNGLDPAGIVEFRDMIRSFVEEDGRTVFISSHLLDEVQKLADDIAIVQAGQLVMHGPVDRARGRRAQLDAAAGGRRPSGRRSALTAPRHRDRHRAQRRHGDLDLTGWITWTMRVAIADHPRRWSRPASA